MPLPNPDGTLVHFETGKFTDWQMHEVIFEGISFILTIHTADEIRGMLAGNDPACLSLDGSVPGLCGVGIAFGHHVLGNEHVPAINSALVALGQLICQGMQARAVYWRSENRLVDFDDYMAQAGRKGLSLPTITTA